ncbi:MAG TPA: hypoxanthine-guanine phosphoribosyltransferase [Burkholderiales bacterium]|nr:hypoxanthine-guanine phosphoribosyltransferase [Burkholderiales bacterium]
MKVSPEEAWSILNSADVVCSATEVLAAVDRMAADITAALSQRLPLVLSVMRGSVIFAGHLLPRLRFPLDFDYLDVTRYGNETSGGEITWKVSPGTAVAGRVVLVVDDILDEGHTLAAVRDKLMTAGALEVHSAVFAEKDTGRVKPLRAEFTGIMVPNRYVFGFGMDVKGAWRNLPAVYALRDS